MQIEKSGVLEKIGLMTKIRSLKYEGKVLGEFSFDEGLAKVYRDGHFGFIDKKFKEVIPCVYSDVGNFEEGLVAVAIETADKQKKWGFVDKQNNQVIKPQYSGVRGFSEGLAAVATGEFLQTLWGFIDKEGKSILPNVYNYRVTSFEDGFAWVAVETGLVSASYGYKVNGVLEAHRIDKNGNVLEKRILSSYDEGKELFGEDSQYEPAYPM
jgi:hypothetical protein